MAVNTTIMFRSRYPGPPDGGVPERHYRGSLPGREVLPHVKPERLYHQRPLPPPRLERVRLLQRRVVVVHVLLEPVDVGKAVPGAGHHVERYVREGVYDGGDYKEKDHAPEGRAVEVPGHELLHPRRAPALFPQEDIFIVLAVLCKEEQKRQPRRAEYRYPLRRAPQAE